MTARRTIAIILLVIAAGFLVVAALTPLRSSEVAELDAEARRLGEAWVEATSDNLLETSAEADQLLEESNEFYARARAAEAPMAPLTALGGALLAAAGGVALWPAKQRDDADAVVDVTADETG